MKAFLIILFSSLLISNLSIASEASKVEKNRYTLEKQSDSVNNSSLARDQAITVFTAKSVITMDSANPRATAVAVAKGKIVSVGSLDSLAPWMNGRKVVIDDTFKDNILMPGFIDPHVHPSLPAILTQFPFIAPDDWSLPTGEFPGATTPKAYRKRLTELVTKHQLNSDKTNNKIPFITWGYHALWHGDIDRTTLDEWFPNTPVILWQRSFHELLLNTTALMLLGISESGDSKVAGVDWSKGHFYEVGLPYVISKMTFLFKPQRYGKGLQNFAEMLHQGGVTSAMDMGTGIFGDPAAEMAMIKKVIELDSTPSRMVLTPIITDFINRGVEPDKALEEVTQLQKNNSPKVSFDKHFKLMLDGAIFSGLAQYNFPGYLDGHDGVWLASPELNYEYAKVFWQAGFQIHAHTNGDKSAAALISIIKKLQAESPRFDHRSTLEHFAYANQDQIRQLGNLNVAVSANPYYQYILSDIYADKWLGEDRAKNMVPLGAASREGLTIALHSDSPMAPLSPLTLVSAAVNRTTINGNKNNKRQALSVDQALRAITIDAAWVMNKEQEIGSIIAGKTADFVVLDKDPYKVKPEKLQDINILATVFEGRAFAIK